MVEKEFHAIASLFPLLGDNELKMMAADIEEHGLREPIRLFEDKILDGRNRYLACLIADVTPEYLLFEGNRIEALAFVWSENFARRHLTSSQAAACLVDKEYLEAEFALEVEKMREEARERQDEGRKLGGQIAGRGRSKQENSFSQSIDESYENPNARRTDSRLARSIGTNRQHLADMRKISEEHPEYREPIKAGEKTITQAKREIKKAEITLRLATLPSEKYRVIYADPPWNYGNSGAGIDQYGPAERHYPSLTIAELCAIDIQSIIEENAVLFLWVTSPLLDECWPVIKAWGFQYKTSFIWDKVKHNYGHYNSVRHELLLICTRGSCTPDNPKLYDSVQVIDRSESHSEKPEEFRAIIDDLYPYGKRIELFARKKVNGWDYYGNEG